MTFVFARIKQLIPRSKFTNEHFYRLRATLPPLGEVFYRGELLCSIFEDHDELEEEEASGGVKEQGVRYVLVISLLSAVLLLSVAWMGMALYGT